MRKTREVLAINLKRARDAKGWTQAELAEHSGLSLKMVQKIEYSQTSPSTDTLDKLARAFKIPVAELFGALKDAPPMPGGVQEAIDILTHLEDLHEYKKAYVLALIFDDERYITGLTAQPGVLQALRKLQTVS